MKQNEHDDGAIADDVIEKENKPLSELTHEEALERLAKLPPLEYEKQRKEAAEELGIDRIQILDKEVSKARKEYSPDSSAGKIVSLYEPKPWHEPVNAAEVLQMAADAINRHMVIRSADADAAALWAMHSHVFNVFSHSARFLITAPDAEC